MPNDDDLDAWDDTLEESKGPSIGANKEMLRKALALNPELRKAMPDSTVLLTQIEDAKSGKPGQPAAQKGAAAAAPGNIADSVRQLRQELAEKKKELAAQRAALDAQEKALLPALCDRMIDAILAIDPNMTSPKTAFIMKQEKAFFDAIGFNTQKLVEREATRK